MAYIWQIVVVAVSELVVVIGVVGVAVSVAEHIDVVWQQIRWVAVEGTHQPEPGHLHSELYSHPAHVS